MGGVKSQNWYAWHLTTEQLFYIRISTYAMAVSGIILCSAIDQAHIIYIWMGFWASSVLIPIFYRWERKGSEKLAII